MRRAEPVSRPVGEAWFGDYLSMKNVYGSADGGPNGPVSLDDERAAYVAEGGVPAKHVPPAPPA